MRYFFKLDENNVILDAKESIETIYQWTEVPQYPYSVWVGMMNNPNSLVNQRKGIPQYINNSVGVGIPHPKNGLIPEAKPTVTEFNLDGTIALHRELTDEEIQARSSTTSSSGIILSPDGNI